MEEDTIQAMRAKLDAAQAAREAVLLRHMAAGVLIDSRDIYIDETVQIAPGARILPGTILRGNTVIGAGSVVTKDIPSGVIAAGNPCRVIRKITQADLQYYFKDRKFDAEAFETVKAAYEKRNKK